MPWERSLMTLPEPGLAKRIEAASRDRQISRWINRVIETAPRKLRQSLLGRV